MLDSFRRLCYNSAMRHCFLLLLLCAGLLAATPGEAEFTAARQRMVEEQIQGRGITDPRIAAAFLKVKRHLFVRPQDLAAAYGDHPLLIGAGQTISQPYIVAVMTYVIAPEGRRRVLEIGTGSGYQAAILAELVPEVYTIEIIPTLTDKARRTLTDMGYRNIHFKTGNGYLGWKEYAPFDGIIVTCAPDHIPQPLIDQLAVGGRMVIPISYSTGVQDLILIEKDANGKLRKTDLIAVQFVPMVHSQADR